MKNADQPINPITNKQGFLTSEHSEKITEDKYSGLSKREYFAGLAMQGFVSNSEITKMLILKNKGDSIARDIAVMAFGCSDELLKQLETTQAD